MNINKLNKLNKEIIDKMQFLDYEIEKSKETAQLVNNVKQTMLDKELLVAKSSLIKTYEMALQHDCFHDIITENEVEKTVTIAFLPYSTSSNQVLCGIQKFDKININLNFKVYKNFYITRLLFHKTMTKTEYIEWSLKKRYQNMKIKKAIFNEVQKDLDDNNYSLLKDSDLYNFNVEFFSKELPLVKFKFTDLVE